MAVTNSDCRKRLCESIEPDVSQTSSNSSGAPSGSSSRCQFPLGVGGGELHHEEAIVAAPVWDHDNI